MARHNRIGMQGEQLAVEWLVERGYAILSRNWRTGRSEVDIIAQTGKTTVFVEVKTRSSEFFGFPEESVGNKKQQQMAEVAEAFCTIYPDENRDVRYDIIAVILNDNEKKVEHLEDAFFPDNLRLRFR